MSKLETIIRLRYWASRLKRILTTSACKVCLAIGFCFVLSTGFAQMLSSDRLSAAQLSRSVTYLDGLGRPIQVVQVSGSPNQKDIVQHVGYDQFAREIKKYLPYADATAAGGSYKNAQASLTAFYATPPVKVGGVNHPYSATVMQASPLNRVIKQSAPGSAWQLSSGHTVRLEYASNNAASLVAGKRWRFSIRAVTC